MKLVVAYSRISVVVSERLLCSANLEWDGELHVRFVNKKAISHKVKWLFIIGMERISR